MKGRKCEDRSVGGRERRKMKPKEEEVMSNFSKKKQLVDVPFSLCICVHTELYAVKIVSAESFLNIFSIV